MCPGECIVHDMGGEFCNNLAKILHDSFGVSIRITSAGRPQPNGQAESAVRNVKAKMEAFMAEIGNWFSVFISDLEKIKKCESGAWTSADKMKVSYALESMQNVNQVQETLLRK